MGKFTRQKMRLVTIGGNIKVRVRMSRCYYPPDVPIQYHSGRGLLGGEFYH